MIEATRATSGSRQAVATWARLVRPRQWIKNLVLFAGLLFTGTFALVPALRVGLACVLFCALSSAGYLLNDVLDASSDRAHPLKCDRPIAAGRIAPRTALLAAVLLAAGALAGAAWLHPGVAGIAAAYLVLVITYSCLWKHRVILDLGAITAGFLLRAWAGTVLLGLALSPWLLVCLSMLSLLLGCGKRAYELRLLGAQAVAHRRVLAQYTPAFAEQMVGIMATSVILTYALYALSSPTAQQHPALAATVPLVLYAVLRYLHLLHGTNLGGQPEEAILTDRPLLLTLVLWCAAVAVIVLCHGPSPR